MVLPMNNWTAGIFMVLYVAPFAVVVYSRRHRLYAKRIRAWRHRMTAAADQPFHLRVLSAPERSRLIGRGGLTSEEWFRAVAAEFVAGRRNHMPTCGEYLAEFGKRPKVRASQS